MLCFLLLAGCAPRSERPSGETPVPTQSEIPAKPLPPAVTTPAADPAPGAVTWTEQGTQKDYTATDGTVIMTASIALPAIDDPTHYAPWAAINNFYADLATELLRDANDQALWAADDYGMATGSGFEFSRYYMEHSFRIPFESDRFVSILRTGSAGIEGMESGTWAFAELFDLTTGNRLSFADCFGGILSDAQALVLGKVTQLAAGTAWAGADTLLERHFSTEHFYLTETAFVVFYNPGELSELAGQPGVPVEFSIPFESLGEAWILW